MSALSSILVNVRHGRPGASLAEAEEAARAAYMILDEATSALDTASEREVQKALTRIKRSWKLGSI